MTHAHASALQPRLASVADDRRNDDEAAAAAHDAASQFIVSDGMLDALCERLAWWVHTRKLYGAPRGPLSLLGKLRTGTRALKTSGGGPDTACSALLSAMYIAVLHEPPDALDRCIFELNYFHRVSSIKTVAAELGIGRPHWYTLLRNFRRRVYSHAMEIHALNEAEVAAMPSRRLSSASDDKSGRVG